ncbi:MAG: riboflavin biosynthesis protein RibF, partial [Candidatus Dormibacteraeota bacterium]|nr:riboflavin biosynthesis protein RibF [Candidatus Dormibacteraeota bacterium]
MTDRIPGLTQRGSADSPVVLTLGTFDGVHRGHQHLLHRVRREAEARHAIPVALTFDPPPRCVVDPDECPAALSDAPERVALLLAAGAAETHVVRFDAALSRWSAERFLDALLAWGRVRALVTGAGFTMGHRRQGDVPFLVRYGAAHGFDVVTVDALLRRGAVVSSSRVRQELAAGRVGSAASLLGRRYAVPGVVVQGRSRGHRLGFPTANLEVPRSRCLPATGIYATYVHVAGRRHAAATSIGYNPTFANQDLSVEPHLIDFDGDLYGRSVRLE